MDAHTKAIKQLEAGRRKDLRQAKRAAQRRRKALRQGRWKDARKSLRTARRNREEAQAKLKRIRTLRKARKRANIAARLLRNRRPVIGHKGLVWLDGKMVASWIADDLKKIRAAGRWKGYVVSGWRDPVYSERLCLSMCGHVTCSGRCAGRSSRHSGIDYPNGAADVSDYFTAASESRRLGLRLKNALPNDRVHLSSDGH
jgi:hypothetical protein